MSNEITITFDSKADVWRVSAGTRSIAIPLEQMIEEYYRWKSTGADGEWRDHAKEFCRQRLETKCPHVASDM